MGAKVPRSSTLRSPTDVGLTATLPGVDDDYESDDYDDDTEDDETEDGDLPPLVEACVALHEVYLALLEGGFTEREGCRIIALAMAEGDLTE